MLYIDKILETMPYGKTKPIKVKASDGEVYVVKFRTDGMARKDRSITNEFIAYRLLEKLDWQIAPLPLKLIQIDDIALELAENASIDPLSLAYIRDSLGVNIAIPYIDNCEKAEIEGIIHDIIEEIPKEWETYSDGALIEEILCARAVSKKIFE